MTWCTLRAVRREGARRLAIFDYHNEFLKPIFRLSQTLTIGVLLCSSPTGLRAADCLPSAIRLLSSDDAASDRAAEKVAVGGIHALVGVPYDNAMGREDAGAVIAFRWDGSQWIETQKLTALQPQVASSFGCAVALSGDRAVIGRYPAGDTGAAFVYRYTGGSWQLETTLRQPEGELGTGFGFAVDIVNDQIIVANPWRERSVGVRTGAAYIFRLGTNGWLHSATLVANDGAHSDLFGESVSLASDDDVAVVGASRDDDRGVDSGSAYVFRGGDSGSWTQEAKLTAADGVANNIFGMSVGAGGSAVAVGARLASVNGLLGAGAVYVFRYSAGTWRHEAKLYASDVRAGDNFGKSVSMLGDSLVVGAPLAEDHSLAFARTSQGAVYLFQYEGGTSWQEVKKIFAPDGYYYDVFGSSVDLSAEWMIAGSPGDATGGFDSGSAYVMDVSCLATATAGCSDAGDCDDGNACTTDTCSGGECSNFANTDACNDGNACTLNDRCGNGVCTGTPKNCNDNIACTVDSCTNGACTYNFAACQCQTASACNDNNGCTTDTCVAGACVHTPNTLTCNDNNACTTNDRCASGVCAGTPMVCNDNNACTDDACVSGSCQYTANLAPCNDNNACTTNDRCANKACAGTPMVCNDNIACTVDSCVNGACNYNAAGCQCRTHADCNDNNACTNDLCSSFFTCQRVNNLSLCNDGDACTTGDVCASGVCRGLPMACNDGNPCTADSCSNGVCAHAPTIAPCSDGDPCTTGDACAAGACQGSEVHCDDGRACTSDFCLNGSCVYDATGCQCTSDTGCNDNDPCTIDRCSSGACFHGLTLDCCGNGLCEPGEDCACAEDCGPSSAREAVGKTCNDGVDNDCDELIDCEDPDCATDALCWECDRDGICELGEDCKNCPSDCTGESSARRMRRFCCGNGVKEPGEANGDVCDGNF